MRRSRRERRRQFTSGDDLTKEGALAKVAAKRKTGGIKLLNGAGRSGHNKAASLIERMEHDGVVSRPNHKGLAKCCCRTMATGSYAASFSLRS